MKKKLNCILLVDDDSSTNYLHKMVIEEVGCAEKCVAVQSGEAALEYLNEHPAPGLIFLDINMPAMNGWEFLEAYQQLDCGKEGTIVVVMLTTSLNPDDKEKARQYGEINGFNNKPLTTEMVGDILHKHFPDGVG